MDFEYSPKVAALRERLLDFMNEYVYPAEAEYFAALDAGGSAHFDQAASATGIVPLAPIAETRFVHVDDCDRRTHESITWK